MRIKQSNNAYSNEIPIGVSVENVDWDSTNDLKQVLGNIDMSNKGNIQSQIDNINNNLFSISINEQTNTIVIQNT